MKNKNKFLTIFLIFALGLLLTNCASLPAPQINDSYIHKDSFPSVGLSVIDEKNKDKMGSVGLSSFKMEGLDLILSKILRNDLNSMWKVNVNLDYEKDSRLPFFIDASIKSCSFVSADALLDDADGECTVKVTVLDLTKKVIFTETYMVNNKMSVSWPSMSKNSKIIKDLLQKVSLKIAKDNALRKELGFL